MLKAEYDVYVNRIYPDLSTNPGSLTRILVVGQYLYITQDKKKKQENNHQFVVCWICPVSDKGSSQKHAYIILTPLNPTFI